MKINPWTLSILATSCLLLGVSAYSDNQGGDGVGNGGSIHYCPHADTGTPTAEMADLYEGRTQRGAIHPSAGPSVLDYLNQYLYKVHQKNPAVALGTRRYLKKLRTILSPQVNPVLEKTKDAHFKKWDADCSIEQLANWTRLEGEKEDTVITNLDYLLLLNERNLAAFYAHESSSAYAREFQDEVADPIRGMIANGMDVEKDFQLVGNPGLPNYSSPFVMELDLTHAGPTIELSVYTAKEESWVGEIIEGGHSISGPVDDLTRGGDAGERTEFTLYKNRPTKIHVNLDQSSFSGEWYLNWNKDGTILSTFLEGVTVLLAPTMILPGFMAIPQVVPFEVPSLRIVYKGETLSEKIFPGNSKKISPLENLAHHNDQMQNTYRFYPSRKFRPLTEDEIPRTSWVGYIPPYLEMK